MKHLATVFNVLKGLLIALIWGCATSASAQAVDALDMDSVEISLLTCAPHDEIYSLYGHTAIRFHDTRKEGTDVAFNYGIFNFHKPYFVLRFVFGLTDYELGVYPFSLFQAEYRRFGSAVIKQVLNLTAEEKLRLYEALSENLKPENRVYRYNYFYNNCTTKARDIIEQCINGKIKYANRVDYTPTFREMIHEHTRNNPWARFGNDLLLGIKTDQKTTLRQQEFLPENLMYDFDRAEIYSNGSYRPLVKERRTAVPAGVQMTEQGFPLSPNACGIILGIVATLIFILEMRKRCVVYLWDLFLITLTGVIGIVLFLMLFSQHPTVSLNLQFVLLNPLPWFFLWPVMKGKTLYWKITSVLAILFLIGGLFQTYPAGIHSLAYSLLLQCWAHLRYKKND